MLQRSLRDKPPQGLKHKAQHACKREDDNKMVEAHRGQGIEVCLAADPAQPRALVELLFTQVPRAKTALRPQDDADNEKAGPH